MLSFATVCQPNLHWDVERDSETVETSFFYGTYSFIEPYWQSNFSLDNINNDDEDTGVEMLKNILTRDSFEKKQSFPYLLSQRLQNTADLAFGIRNSLQWIAWENTKQ